MGISNVIADAIEKVADARAELAELEEEYPEIFREYFSRIDKYNDSVTEARSAIHDDRFEDDIKTYPGGFKAVKRYEKKYDPEVLREECSEIFQMKGVVKSVDTTAISQLRQFDAYPEDILSRAYTEKMKSVAVYGPKPLVIKM